MSDSIVNMEAKQDANRTAGESSGQNPLKKQIDPLELLNCLSILLNSKGAIKSIDEVQRVAGLMGKYSKKLVSKCIYLNILQATEEPLLDEFYKETGWNLVCAWLTEAMATKNYPLAQQILTLLLVSPITVERLKRNNMPKMVKDLSKDCPHAGARETAENVVQRWKDLVKVFSSEGPNAANRELGGTEPHPESSADCVRVSVINPVPLNMVNSHVSAIIVNNKSVIDEANKSDLTTSEAESVAESTIPETKTSDPPVVVTENPPIPKLKVGRGRGSPGRGGLRGVGRGRARRKRGTVGAGRGRGKSLISYAELLCQDIDSTYDPSDEAKEDNRDSNSSTTSSSSSNEDVSSTNPPAGASVPPLRIAIRNGVKVLPAETKGTASKAKRKRPSVDSTDSDDNKPLSIIRNERHKLAVDVNEEKSLPQDKDKSLPKDSEVKSAPTEIVKDEVKGASTDKINDEVKVEDDDDDEVVVKSRVKGKRRILVYKSDDDDDEEEPPVKKESVDGAVAVKDSKEPKSENEKKKKKEEEKAKSKELEDGTDKPKSKDSDKKKDKKSSSEKSIGKTDKEREKNREKERERERSKHKGSKDKYRDRDKDKDKDRDKSRDKDRDRKDDKKKDKDRRRDSDDKDRRNEQAEKDKATLDKVKPLSTEGMGKIPRKSSTSSVTSPKIVTTTPVSFLDALGSADSDLAESKKALLVKSKSRGFRNTGLLDETIKPPGVAGKRLTEVPPKRQGTSSSSSSSSSTSDLFDHKKVLKAPSSAPPSGDRPGGIKLISPKRPTLSDDGGFMAALTAAGADRKKISRKRKSSDSENKSEGTQSKINKTETSKESLDDSIKSEEDGVSPLKSIPEDDCAKKQEEKVEDGVLLSPTSIKPTFNFYKDTLVETSGKEEPSTPADKEEGASNFDSETVAPSEATAEEETVEELPSSNDTKKDDDPMEIEELDDVDTKEEPMEIAGGGDGEEDNNCIISFGGKEESMDRDGVSDTNLLQEAPVPAPAQEDYEKVEVTFTPTKDLRGVLVYHRPQNRRKRNVKWKADTELKEIFYFPMDETERVNVNTIKFNDMMMMEKAKEKEFMFGKNRNRILTENHLGMMDSGMANTCIDYGPYKLYPVHSSNPSNVTPGYKSMEKHVQAQREHNTMATFFHPSMLPETPTEPDPEMVQRAEPVNIPLKDVSGSDSVSDNRNIPWPEPLFDQPSGFPFVGNSAPHAAPPVPPQSGGHWVLGNHTVSRFAGGPSLYGGPPGPQGPQGPVNNPVNFGPPQGFPGEMRGGWGGPSDFGGPPVLLPNGPPMGMGVGMGGPNPGMHGGPPLQSGPVMGMGGGPPPMGNRDNYHRYNRRGGSGNWGGPQGGRGFCKHFRHGNCRHGDDCKFLHVPS